MLRAERGARGSAIVGSVFNLLVYLTLLLGFAGMGWAIYVYNQVSKLAREGTQYAMVRGYTSPNPATTADIRNFVRSRASGLDPQELIVLPTWTPDNRPGSVVKVQVVYVLYPLGSLVPQQPVTFESSSQMVISR